MEKMISCKTCGAEIAKSAKVCPNCGAKIKKHKALGIVLTVFGVLILIGALSGGNSGPEKVGDDPNSTGVQNEMSGKFKVGEIVKLNDVYVTLVGVEISKGANFLTPSSGNVFAICEFEIDNQSSKELAISSLLCFEAYADDYAVNLSVSAMGATDKTQLDGKIAAGKKMNGVVGYEIPSDWKDLELHFTPDFWSGGDIIFVATND